ncbi:glycoside hydrolase family 3 N-terminal domain-containing protein [Arthrobacter sp. 754]|uniref:glycoside hydrolase family 3 protein n=1 Tax=Arthrobacter sp. 754 TaxID=3156315 RepID=UPI00339AD1ED
MTPNTPRFPFQDAALPVAQRAADLLSRLSLEDKAGVMFHDILPFAAGTGPAHELIGKRRLNHFNILGAALNARDLADWHNSLQEIALATGPGIPITLSTDPRHAYTDNPGTAAFAGPFSQWPEALGFAAVGDPGAVEEFADIARQEYLAVGIRSALHPQVDVFTEPRWSRGGMTFGESAEMAATLVGAYVRGFQTEAFGPASVSTMTKHFPGGGPQLNGEDPHFSYGREQVYPGGNFEYHLLPFRAAIAAGSRQMMPYYGMPVGTAHEEVGFAFNKGILTDLLRTELGFQGVVCTDWGILTDGEILGRVFPARAWGVEHLTPEERMLKALDAGVDQFGGEHCVELMVAAVRAGRLSEERLDTSVRKILAEKFLLGLFENPFVDAAAADSAVGTPWFKAAGRAMQRRSYTLLKNQETDGVPLLPLRSVQPINVYSEGISAEDLGPEFCVVATAEQADVAILRLRTPFEIRGTGFLESFFHCGNLAFAPQEVERLTAICRTVPTIIDINLERPAVIPELAEHAAALLANYGSDADALVDVLTGRAMPEGKLPFDLPRSMAAVEASREDVPFDTENPVFRYGHGLSLTNTDRTTALATTSGATR